LVLLLFILPSLTSSAVTNFLIRKCFEK